MSHEAAIVHYYGFDGAGGRVKRVVASSAVIAKGALLTLADLNTVSSHATATANAIFGGIAAEEKKGDGEDYTTEITALTDCVASLRVSGAVRVGAPVCLALLPNHISAALTAFSSAGWTKAISSGAQIVGTIQDTASDGETVRVRIRCAV